MSQEKIPHRAVGVNRSVLCCRFWTNGSSAPATVYGKEVYSVAHTATGKWTITFNDGAKRVVGIATALGLATPAPNGLSAQIDNEGDGSRLAVVVSYHNGSALADIAANGDKWISVVVEVEQEGS